MLSLSAFSHAGSFSFTEPTMCVGAFPVGAICLILLPLIIVLFLAILFGGLVAGNEAAQLFSWNFLEILGAFGWLGAFASPVGCLLMTLLKVANLSFIPKKGLDESLSPTWPPFWALLLILIAQTVVFESVAYLKDRVDSRPLEFTPSKFPRQRAARLDRDVLAERDRVLQMLHAAGEQDQGDEANLLTGAKTFKAFGASIAKKASHLKTAILDSVAEDSRPPILRGDVADADEAGLAVFQLRKIYLPLRFGGKAVEAVQNVTFGVRLGECFGLLGANGAGKTTTMSMVMRATEPTSGDAKVGGFSVLTEFSKAASALGVVNQHNTLWETLSCAAHLRAFAKLRGLEGSAVEAAVRDTLRRVELEPHSHKLARALSGGMKRKLCCAAALIGDPSVVLLDEPSAGLDPVSQRNLWNLLKSTMAGRAVVLTTHSMLEADVLCHRIGIMVRGQLSCLGTPAHLKARYASGSELVCKLASVDEKHGEDAISKLEHFVAHEFQGATLASADADVVTFEIPQSKKSLLGQTFAVFDQHVCDELGVAEFALLPASIEKVFIRIVATDAGRGDAKGRALAAELQQLESDDLEDELGHLLFTEKTCCGLSRYAHLMLAKYNACASCTCCCYLALAILGAPWPACAAGAYCCLAALFAAMGSCASFTCCLQKPKTDE